MGMTGWFRWYRGTSADTKLHLVAKRSQQPMGFVVAVWAMLLERASENDSNGSLQGFDAEAADLNLDLPEGTTSEILQAMADKGMIANNSIANWRKRQPLREDPNSTQRSRDYRARKKAEMQCNAMQHDATQCNEVQRMETHATECNKIDENLSEKTTDFEGSTQEETAEKSVENQDVTDVQRNATQCNATQRQNRIEENIIREKNTSYSSCPDPKRGTGRTQEQALLTSLEVQPEEPPVILLPLNDGTDHPVKRQEVDQWAELYPSVDVEGELKRMKGWLLASKQKRKTKNGINKFINAWLDREQNRPHVGHSNSNSHPSALSRCSV